MATRTLLTLDQFRALVDENEDRWYELSGGELIELSRPTFKHGTLLAAIVVLLANALDRKRYLITGGDPGFILDSDPAAVTVRGADVAVVRREDADAKAAEGWYQGAPLLAVEVISPSNTAKDMQLKVKQYLAAGTSEVWLVYPDTETVYVYSSGQRNPQVFEKDETFISVVEHEFRVSDFFAV